MKHKQIIFFLIATLIVVLFGANLLFGSVHIPFMQVVAVVFGQDADQTSWAVIILQYRIPQAITALLAGAALSVCGLMLQTLFQNPLADPSILGVSSGANLGVAIVLLFLGRYGLDLSAWNSLSVIIAAFFGAMAVLGLIIYFAAKVKSNLLVLIIGLMIGYLVSSGISILNSIATSDEVHSFVLWGLGSFSSVSAKQLPFFSLSIILGLFFSVLLIKPLNALLLGERYAGNLGINVKRIRLFILLCTGLLIAVVTAFCGPVSFIGLAVPHLARLSLNTSNQKILLPATLLLGSAVALLCNLMTVMPFANRILPLNAVTPVLGAPVIIYIILNRKNTQYFN